MTHAVLKTWPMTYSPLYHSYHVYHSYHIYRSVNVYLHHPISQYMCMSCVFFLFCICFFSRPSLLWIVCVEYGTFFLLLHSPPLPPFLSPSLTLSLSNLTLSHSLCLVSCLASSLMLRPLMLIYESIGCTRHRRTNKQRSARSRLTYVSYYPLLSSLWWSLLWYCSLGVVLHFQNVHWATHFCTPWTLRKCDFDKRGDHEYNVLLFRLYLSRLLMIFIMNTRLLICFSFLLINTKIVCSMFVSVCVCLSPHSFLISHHNVNCPSVERSTNTNTDT